MATGTNTYDGMADPLFGESEIKQQTAATDLFTLTGASSMTGDYVVMRTSAGVEEIVFNGVSSSGSVGITVNVTSTGAIALGAQTNAVGVLVSASSKANMTAAFAYSVSSTAVHVGACNHLLMSNGSKAPTYFLGVSASVGPGIGAIAANGFLDNSLLINTFTCDHPFIGLKCMAGSVAFYLLGAQSTGIT